MDQRITLTEHTPTILPLTSADLSAFVVDGKKKLTITPTATIGEYEVNPNQFVGVMRLPSGLTLDLIPKVPLFNVMWMIAEVERLEGIDFDRLEQEVQVSTFEDILEPIVRAFAEKVEQLIERGLYRTYVEQEDNLTAIRGRIDFREDLNRNIVLRHRTYCRFTEFSWDVPENQAIRQVVRKLVGWGFSPRLTGMLMSLDRQLDDVTRTHFSASDMDRFSYSRQSEHYRAVHQFCRLFLSGFSLSEGAGDSPFDGFLMDMNILFERFAAIKLNRHLPPIHWKLDLQVSSPLFDDFGLTIRPDLLLKYRGTNTLVADTKYKKRTGDDSSSADYYQMVTYCTVLGLTDAILIYPRHNSDIHQRLAVKRSPIRVSELSVDLRESRESIESAFAFLAQNMVSRSLEHAQKAVTDSRRI